MNFFVSVSSLYNIRFLTGIFENAANPYAYVTSILKEALNFGSSQHGNTRRAPVGSNIVIYDLIAFQERNFNNRISTVAGHLVI